MIATIAGNDRLNAERSRPISFDFTAQCAVLVNYKRRRNGACQISERKSNSRKLEQTFDVSAFRRD